MKKIVKKILMKKMVKKTHEENLLKKRMKICLKGIGYLRVLFVTRESSFTT